MTNIETLKRRIVKILPEIMKLEFGCEVQTKWGNKKNAGFIFRTFLTGSVDIISYDNTVISTTPEQKMSPQISKILGRPIQLADVLRAVEATETPVNNDWFNFTKKWDLRKNLSEQPPEVHAFLLEVIKE